MRLNSYKEIILFTVAIFLLSLPEITDAQSSEWQPTHGPFGGSSVYSIFTEPDGTIYLGTYSNGVFRTEDDGQTWSQINGLSDIFDLLVTPEGRIILGTDEILWSDDDGENWTYGLEYTGIVSLAQSDELIVAGTDNGIVHFSGDKGATWSSSNLFSGDDNSPYVWDMAILDDETILAATSNGLLTTTLQDTLWVATSIESAVKSLVVSDNGIFAATSYNGLKISTNNADTWNDVADYPGGPITQMTQTGDGHLYVAQLDTMYYSEDYGSTWSGVTLEGLPITDFRSLGADQNGNLLAGIYEAGAYRLNSEEQRWELIGPATTTINELFAAGDGTLMAGTAQSGLHIYDGASGTWTEGPEQFRSHYVNNFFSNITFLGRNPDQDLIMGVSRDIYVSQDDGATWVEKDSGYTVDNFASLTATSWTHSESAGMFIGTYSAGIYHSGDGEYWTSINEGLTGGNTYNIIYDIEAAGDGRIYAGGTWEGLKYWNATDSVWTDLEVGAQSTLAEWVKSIAVHPDGALFAGNDVLRAGATEWEELDLPSRFSYDVETIGITKEGATFIATSRNEVFRSDDTGRSWTNVTEGLPDVEIFDFIDSGDHIYAATNGMGVYQMETTPTYVVEETSNTPGRLQLYANYPNPFNPSTTIRYSLPADLQVTVSVYNMLGQQIATLIDGRQQAGTHSLRFEAAGLSSGIYFYQIKAGNIQKIRKMTLLK